MELYITGFAGDSGSRKLYQNEETRKKLLDHYPKSFFTVLGEKYPKFPETDAPETDAPETDAPETDAPETDAPETDITEAEIHSTALTGTEKEAGDAAAAVLAGMPGVKDLESAAEGGVFGALWRLLKRNRLGAEFSQRAIPVRQQTIEICEFLGLDPYRLESEGCTVWLAEDPAELIRKTKEAGVNCVQIGLTEKGPAIRRTDGAAVAYLRRPET